jgi:hypothetical protein
MLSGMFAVQETTNARSYQAGAQYELHCNFFSKYKGRGILYTRDTHLHITHATCVCDSSCTTSECSREIVPHSGEYSWSLFLFPRVPYDEHCL